MGWLTKETLNSRKPWLFDLVLNTSAFEKRANLQDSLQKVVKNNLIYSMRETEEEVTGEGYDWAELLPTYKKILSNVAYVSMTGVLTTNMGTVSVIAIYGIQYLSEVYNMSIPTSSFTFR